MTTFPVVGGPMAGFTVELPEDVVMPYAVGLSAPPEGDDGRPIEVYGHVGDVLYVLNDGKYLFVEHRVEP